MRFAILGHEAYITRRTNTKSLEFVQAGQNIHQGKKERGARQLHERLLYCVNVKRTSLDHLLLGKNADVDKNVESHDYSADCDFRLARQTTRIRPTSSYRSFTRNRLI